MYLLGVLLVFPFLVALAVLVIRNDGIRSGIVKIAASVISLCAVAFLVVNLNRGIQYFDFKLGFLDRVLFIVEILLAVYIFYISIKFRKFLITGMITVQTAIMVVFRLNYGMIPVTHTFFIDNLSLIMAVIVGIIGSLICVYSVEYMRDYQKRFEAVKDRRSFFFFVIFIFMSAMFGLVFSNNLTWVYFCWEITTLSSFFLIGYSREEEATRNAFCALEYNLWGGIAIALAIYYLYYTAGTVELVELMSMGKVAAMVPVALICLAGISKTAQYPFAKWLLGAMVAPTPVSALLHSSTMVKAGVYIILRFAYVLEETTTGYLIASVGAITFLIGSLTAVSQDDAKRVLAYSTIANLGLIILCAGLGTYEAMWAGLFLIMFHAVTKCLLFLCVGVVDEEMHSRNIEDMCGLIISMPRVSVMMQIGIAGMFLAPFGMLISKWVVIRSILDSNPALLVAIVFGGAATVFFWVKWMGKLTLIERPEKGFEKNLHKDIWIPLYTLTIVTVLMVVLLPLISHSVVVPYIQEIYDRTISMHHDNIIIMAIMIILVFLFPAALVYGPRKVKIVSPYLAGSNTGDGTKYIGAFGAARQMEMRDYYLTKYFGEARLFKWGIVMSLILIAAFLGSALF